MPAGVAGAYGIGTGDSHSCHREQHPALDAKIFGRDFRRNERLGSWSRGGHASPSSLQQHPGRIAAAFLPLRHDLPGAEVGDVEAGHGSALARRNTKRLIDGEAYSFSRRCAGHHYGIWLGLISDHPVYCCSCRPFVLEAFHGGASVHQIAFQLPRRVVRKLHFKVNAATIKVRRDRIPDPHAAEPLAA